MLSRNLYILAGTLLFFAALSYVVAFTGLAHEPGAPADATLWRTIGIFMLLLALLVALLGVLQSMFEQADRRTPGGQAGVRRNYLAQRDRERETRSKRTTPRSSDPLP